MIFFEYPFDTCQFDLLLVSFVAGQLAGCPFFVRVAQLEELTGKGSHGGIGCWRMSQVRPLPRTPDMTKPRDVGSIDGAFAFHSWRRQL